MKYIKYLIFSCIFTFGFIMMPKAFSGNILEWEFLYRNTSGTEITLNQDYLRYNFFGDPAYVRMHYKGHSDLVNETFYAVFEFTSSVCIFNNYSDYDVTILKTSYSSAGCSYSLSISSVQDMEYTWFNDDADIPSTAFSGVSFTGNQVFDFSYVDIMSPEQYSVYISKMQSLSSSATQQETNDKLDKNNQLQEEQNNYLKDDTPPSSDISSLGNVQGLLPPGPVDSLLNIPFQFLTKIVNAFSGTCSDLTFNFIFNQPFTLPCFDTFYSKVPKLLMNFLSAIPAAFILMKYFKHLYKKVDRAISMETSADDEWGAI